jgi:hypothetical protein
VDPLPAARALANAPIVMPEEAPMVMLAQAPLDVAMGVVAALLFALHVAGTLDAWRGVRRIARLADWRPMLPPAPVRVSVVVAARDEAHTIEAGLASLLAQDHPDLEVIVVDDRSTDGTGEVVRRLALSDPRVRCVRVDELPPGWLGKNHALARGAALATGRYLLFTDADVVFQPFTVQRAVAYAVTKHLEHLTASPGIEARSWPLAMLVGTFTVLLGRFTKPWRASDPLSPAYIGIGALNLVRRDAYLAAGGHEAIRLRVDDDLRLGERQKRRGSKQEFVLGRGALSVEWYPSLGAMVHGLEKNAFAGLDFRLSLVVLATVALLALFVAPFALVWCTDQPVARALFLASIVTVVLGQVRASRDAGVAVWTALLAPVGVLVFLFTLWRSTLVTLRQGGVRWRGTLYTLAELRTAAR